MTTAPAPLQVTPFSQAQVFLGLRELDKGDHPLIQYAHSLCGLGHDQPDETPWCSSWMNLIAHLLSLPRSHSAAARSWLNVGTPLPLSQAAVGFDVVVLKRGSNPAQGHVGLFAGLEGDDVTGHVLVLGGNQNDAVSIAPFNAGHVLGIRRLKTA